MYVVRFPDVMQMEKLGKYPAGKTIPPAHHLGRMISKSQSLFLDLPFICEFNKYLLSTYYEHKIGGKMAMFSALKKPEGSWGLGQ